MLQGEDVDPSPMDNHAQHIAKHQEQLARLDLQVSADLAGNAILSSSYFHPNAKANISAHIAEHQQAGSGQMGQMMGGMMGMGGGATLFPQAGQTMGNTMPAVENPAETAQSQLASMLNTGSMNIA